MIGNRYEILGKLGAGGMGMVYLVHDKLRNQKVALKQVLMSDDNQRLAITREFRTLSTLRHPNIVSVIEYGSHENQPYFTMEYLPDAQPFNKQADQKIERFIQMLQAIGYLHRRGILHRDLKPGNVLITSNSTVKVLDFGLALDMARDPASEVGGTMHYMAPELFSGLPATVSSDLWALGVMLCESLANHHPFNTSDVMALLESIIGQPADISGMDDAFTSVVLRLLSKDISERYNTALEVLQDLCTAAGIDLPPESREQRESFLQAAAFVGRDHQYRCLVDALQITVGGKSQLWLVGGEAGAGKSRLLDEARTRALVDGFTVLQGQAVEGGGLPYQLWREPARNLVLGAPMSDLTASILKELVPDIGALLGRDVADIPALDPKANLDRLMAALLERLRLLAAPTLVILEDLHWTSESLDLLNLLLPHLKNLPVMMIGSYRHDEKPSLPEELPDVQLLLLERLTPDAVAALSASMIGAENATPELMERLARETEGNALFMVEVVRALAEEAGSLHRITRKSLPDKILAGGMVAVLQRRLSKVPIWAFDTLKLAAVIGRVIDTAVLKVAGVIDINKWLQACADAVVLEPYQGEWRFSHDRLRETLLHEMTGLADLHEKAARAIEAVYPDNVNHAESLAQHWRIAGNSEREVHYIIKAAEQLINFSGNYARAETLLQRGLELNQRRAELLLWVGQSAEKQAQYEAAVTAYQTALDSDPPHFVQASILNHFGSVYRYQGKFAQADAYVRQAHAIAEKHGDTRNHFLSLNLLGSIAINQGNYAAGRAHYETCLGIGLDDRLGTATILNNLGNLAGSQGDFVTAQTYYRESLHIRREIGDRAGTAQCLNNLGVIAMFLGDYITGRAYFEEGLLIQRDIGNRQAIAQCLSNLAITTDNQGDTEAARGYYEESLTIARAIGAKDIALYAASGLATVGERESTRATLIEALQIARDLNVPLLRLIALLAAAYWLQTHERSATWVGLMQGEPMMKNYPRFKRLCDELRATMGEEAFNAALERGKMLDVKTLVEELIRELLE